MTRIFVAAAVAVLAIPGESRAHRLDEYLQAARVSLARDAVVVEVDLTPGASIAPAIVTLLDRDRDRAISPGEAGAYGQAVLADLAMDLDGQTIPLTLSRVEMPSLAEMHDGLGTIRLRASGSVQAAAGRHRLRVRNTHQPVASVYLANALVPEDRAIAVVAQARDPRQQELRVEYRRWLALARAAALAVARRSGARGPRGCEASVQRRARLKGQEGKMTPFG